MTEYTTEKCKLCGYSGAEDETGVCYRLTCKEKLLESENAKLKQDLKETEDVRDCAFKQINNLQQENERLMKIVRNVAHVQITKENIKDARQIIRDGMEREAESE